MQPDGKIKTGQGGQRRRWIWRDRRSRRLRWPETHRLWFADGKAQVVQPHFKISHPNDVRVIEPSPVISSARPCGWSIQGGADAYGLRGDQGLGFATAAVTEDGRGADGDESGEENFSGEIEWSNQTYNSFRPCHAIGMHGR